MSRAGPWLAAAALAAGAAVAAPRQGPPPGAPSDWEGPVDNDAWLPVDREAEEALARGDALYLELERAGFPGTPTAERTSTLCFESWSAALSESATGESVPPRPQGAQAGASSPWPDPDGTAEAAGAAGPRRTEGVEYAILRRLAAVPPAVRAAWTRRFAGRAADLLIAAGSDAVPLAALERLHPATPAACRAALRLAELAFEEGRIPMAEQWLERAGRHLDLAAVAMEPEEKGLLERALAARRAALEGFAEPEPARPQAWASAAELAPLAQAVVRERWPRARAGATEPWAALQPGLAFLAGGEAAIQAGDRVVVLDPARAERLAEFEPQKLLATAEVTTGRLSSPSLAPGWPLLPATDGAALVLVHGRAQPGRPNALLCVDLEPPSPAPERPRALVPRLRWALWNGVRVGPGGERAHLEPAEPLAGAEFQPGPLVAGSLVLVGVRRLEETAVAADPSSPAAGAALQSWLVALDLLTGEVRWARLIAQGVEVQPSAGRMATVARETAGAQPLALAGNRVFAGTHTGAGALVELCDGRVAWTFKNRRRRAGERGWSGFRPPTSEDPPALVWAPADSDHIYWMRAEPDLGSPQSPGGRGILLHPPRAIGEALGLLGGDADEALVLSRAGRERALRSWNAATGGGYSSLYLGPGERFTGAGVASPQRALFATDRGLYLLDRTRELYLAAYAPLREIADTGGATYAHGERVWVVGSQVVWLFEAR